MIVSLCLKAALLYKLVNIIRRMDIAWLMQWCPKDSHHSWHKIELPKTSQNVDSRFPVQYCWGIKSFGMRYCVQMCLLVFWMNAEKHWPNENASNAQHQIMFYILKEVTVKDSPKFCIKIPVLFSIYWVFQPPWIPVAIQPLAWRNYKTLHISAKGMFLPNSLSSLQCSSEHVIWCFIVCLNLW